MDMDRFNDLKEEYEKHERHMANSKLVNGLFRLVVMLRLLHEEMMDCLYIDVGGG